MGLRTKRRQQLLIRLATDLHKQSLVALVVAMVVMLVPKNKLGEAEMDKSDERP